MVGSDGTDDKSFGGQVIRSCYETRIQNLKQNTINAVIPVVHCCGKTEQNTIKAVIVIVYLVLPLTLLSGTINLQ